MPGQSTVAIIDNHPLFRRTMRLILTRMDYEVVMEGANGEEFIEKLRAGNPPGICLIDINMPVMNGFETTRHIKQHWPSVKVILFSLNASEDYQKSAAACGADGFWAKSSSVELLQEILDRIKA